MAVLAERVKKEIKRKSVLPPSQTRFRKEVGITREIHKKRIAT